MAAYMIRSLPPGLISRAKVRARTNDTTLDAVLLRLLTAYAHAGTPGQAGGEARAKSLTPEARSAIARKGAQARIAKLTERHSRIVVAVLVVAACAAAYGARPERRAESSHASVRTMVDTPLVSWPTGNRGATILAPSPRNGWTISINPKCWTEAPSNVFRPTAQSATDPTCIVKVGQEWKESGRR